MPFSGGILDGIQDFDKWLTRFGKMVDPMGDQTARPVLLSHGGDGGSDGDSEEGEKPGDASDAPEPYPAALHHPKDFDFNAAVPAASTAPNPLTKSALAVEYRRLVRRYPGIADLPAFGDDYDPYALFPLVKAVDKRKGSGGALPDGGRWITIHPNNDPEEWHRVYIVPNPDGSHSIVAGVGGSLNGLRLSHVKSPEEYKRHASEMRAQKARALKAQQAAQREQMGAQAYEQLQQEKRIQQQEAQRSRISAEKEFIQTVFDQTGADKSVLDIPDSEIAGMDPRVAERLVKNHHQALLAYAKQVARETSGRLVAAFGDVATDALGDVSARELLANSLASSGLGYQSQVQALAEAHGVDASAAKEAAQSVSWRALLDRSEGNVDEALDRQKNQERRTEGAKKAREEVRQAAEKLGQSGSGVGPDAVRSLADAPPVQSVGQAASILAAQQKMVAAQKAEKSFNADLEAVRDAGKLPKAAVVVGKPLSDEEALKAVADVLATEHLTRAMTALVDTSNALETDAGGPGALDRHYSVGANAAMNEIAAAVDRGIVDPLMQDTLGTAGMARVLAHRWRSSIAPEEFAAVKDTLAQHHIATQESIATLAVEQADEFLAAAKLLESGDLDTSGEGLAGAAADLSRQRDLIDQARAAAGIARGRVEAAAAINEALMHTAAKESLQVALGARDAEDGALALGAIGLTKPTRFDDDGSVAEEGEFTLSKDAAGNILAEIHPAGIETLAKIGHDPDVEERARRSVAIKRGEEDEPGWMPAGITRRTKTSFDLDPSQFVQTGHVLRVSDRDDLPTVTQNLREHIGARIQEGQAPFDVLSSVASASFAAGLGLSAVGEARYRRALAAIAPPLAAPAAGATPAEKAEEAKRHREATEAALVSCADDYVAAQQKAGALSKDEAALDSQRLPQDPVTSDILYQAALSDPRLQYATAKLGDLGRDGRAAIRAYWNERIAGLGKDPEAIITPMSPEERSGYQAWQDLKASGDPYRQIQQKWAESAEAEGGGLFDEEPTVPAFASVDLGDHAAVVRCAQQNARALGYMPIRGADGRESYPDLVPGTTWQEAGEGGAMITYGPRTEETIARDARSRIRGKLRAHYWQNIAGRPDLADTGFNPETVQTASDAWGNYCRDIGGEKRAIATIQEFMAGDLSAKVAAGYQQATGKKLTLANRTIRYAKEHTAALLPAGKRGGVAGEKRRVDAQVGQGAGGKFTAGSRQEKREALLQAQEDNPRLIGADESGARAATTERPSLGKAAEGTIAQMMPGIDLSRPVEAATNVSFSDENGVKLQRFVKLVDANERQALNLQAGGGKTLGGLATFTHLRDQGRASKAIFLTPSNVVGQMGAEFYRFVDPAAGLRWHADPGASGEERRAAYADPGVHAVVTTPESLREDITKAIAEDEKIPQKEVVDRMASMSEDQVDSLVHHACDVRGWHFDYSLFDEGHRLLNRAGKPDAHMARVADSLSRMTPVHIPASADPTRNNDPSEVWDLLHKIAPTRYTPETRSAFLRRYGRDSHASRIALQREIEPYIYAERADIGASHDRQQHVLPMTAPQQKEYDRVQSLYNRARSARAKGGIDVEALKELSPGSFQSGEDEGAVAESLQKALGTVRDTALSRVVNEHPGGAKLKWVLDQVAKEPDRPTIVFAHSRQTVDMIHKAFQERGLRAVKLTGDMSSDAKAKAQNAFSPQKGDATADYIICTDAAAQGGNLQRGNVEINVDTPQTAMLHEQRIARAWRRGQKNHVTVHDLVADADVEHRARQRLANKADFREIMTSPAEMIDDGGLLTQLDQERSAAVGRMLMKRAA